MAETNAEVIAEFRANKGEVEGPPGFADLPPMLLVHTTGRRTGRDHVTPMRCLLDGETLYIFASAHGSDRHPDWYRNLVAQPDIVVEIGEETQPYHATVLKGDDRDRIFARHAARFPTFTEMQAKLERTIPVVRLDRA